LSRVRPRLERFPVTCNHVIEKEALKFKDLEHAGIEKAEQLFRDMLQAGLFQPCPTAIQEIVGSLPAVLAAGLSSVINRTRGSSRSVACVSPLLPGTSIRSVCGSISWPAF
jgi:hypothetical protein